MDTFNIWKLQTREYVAIGDDARRPGLLRNKLGYIFLLARVATGLQDGAWPEPTITRGRA